MSLAGLFSRKSSSNESKSISSTRDMATTRGKEIVRGRLLMRKGSSNKRSLAEVVVYCAPHDCSQPGQMEIYEEINKTYQKPKKIISLIDINQPGVQTGSPCTSLSSSPGNAVIFGTSPSSNGISLHPFQLVLRTGEVFEFFAESPEDQRQWVKRLGLLLMFPHSPIPEEPTNSPIKDTFRARLNPADYKADSVWAVYILPEEVGTRVNALGLQVIALRSRGNDNQPGQLDIFNLADPSTPIVTWDRDKMRRTGCLGNMVFIEIGRRCTGGPGLVWMYAGPRETAALRETLHTFLFKGDGRAVPIATQQPVNTQSSNRVSFDSGFPPSYPKRGSSASLHRSPSISTPQRQQSIDSNATDSGLPPSYPNRSSSSAASFHNPSPALATPHRQLSVEIQPGNSSSPGNQPPPINWKSHPNRRHSSRSSISYENVDTDSGTSSYSTNSSSSRRSSSATYMTETTDGDQFDLEEEGGVVRSDTGDVTRHPTFSNPRSAGHYQVPGPLRSHTVSSSRPSLHSGDYEKMINPRGSYTNTHIDAGEQQYVQMKPAPSRSNSFRSYSDSPPKQLHPNLHPISEGRVQHNPVMENYENLSFQSSVEKSEFKYYAPQYENVDQYQKRRGSFNKGVSPGNVRTVESSPSPPVIIATPPRN